MKFISLFKKCVKTAIHDIWLCWKRIAVRFQHNSLTEIIKKKKSVNVVFTAIDATLWRYQNLYELMSADKRFNVTILFTPCPHRNYHKDLAGLRRFFDSRCISYIDYDPQRGPINMREVLSPDIIFYTQPYDNLLMPAYDFHNYFDCLLCYIPYAFWTASGRDSYNLDFHNLAWRLYYSTEMHLLDAKKMAQNHGNNVRVVGYSNTDDFLKTEHLSPWKTINDGKLRKKIIWAPHFTIKTNTIFPPRSNFLWMADLMVQIAKTYFDDVQIAFKPHPSLLKLLYDQEGWGRDKADSYYKMWDEMPNTQLEESEFVDLFMTSDAMIHDCSSFTVEYHYSKKPVMFVSRNRSAIYNELNDFGKLAFNLQYHGSSEMDILNFIENVVIAGNDQMYDKRQTFYDKYLKPPYGTTVAQNIIDDLIVSLQL